MMWVADERPSPTSGVMTEMAIGLEPTMAVKSAMVVESTMAIKPGVIVKSGMALEPVMSPKGNV